MKRNLIIGMLALAAVFCLAAAIQVSIKDVAYRNVYFCQSLETVQKEYDDFAAAYKSYQGRGAFILGAGKYTGTLVTDTDGIDLYDWPVGAADVTGLTITIGEGIDTVNYIGAFPAVSSASAVFTGGVDANDFSGIDIDLTGNADANDFSGVDGNFTGALRSATATVTGGVDANDVDAVDFNATGFVRAASAAVTGGVDANDFSGVDVDLTGNMTAATASVTGGIDANDVDAVDLNATGYVRAASAAITGAVDANDIKAVDVNLSGRLLVDGSEADTEILTGIEASHIRYVSSADASGLQAILDALEASGTPAADDPYVLIFVPGQYASLSLTLGSDHIILDASAPGVVLEGTITMTEGVTGTYLYLWDHPTGTYPGAGLTLVNVGEV
jgi:hypothetical protein